MNEVQLNKQLEILLHAYEQADLMSDNIGRESIKEAIDEVVSKFVGEPVKIANDYLK